RLASTATTSPTETSASTPMRWARVRRAKTSRGRASTSCQKVVMDQFFLVGAGSHLQARQLLVGVGQLVAHLEQEAEGHVGLRDLRHHLVQLALALDGVL